MLAGESNFEYLGFAPTQAVASTMASRVTGGALANLPNDFIAAEFGGTFVKDYVVVGLDSSRGSHGAAIEGTEDPVSSYTGVMASMTVGSLPSWAATQATQGGVTTAVCPGPAGLYATAYPESDNRYYVNSGLAAKLNHGVVNFVAGPIKMWPPWPARTEASADSAAPPAQSASALHLGHTRPCPFCRA